MESPANVKSDQPLREANARVTSAYGEWRLLNTRVLATIDAYIKLGNPPTAEQKRAFDALSKEEEEAKIHMHEALAALAALRGSRGGRKTRRHRRRHRKTLRRK